MSPRDRPAPAPPDERGVHEGRPYWLWRPDGDGPRPAMLILHGAGSRTYFAVAAGFSGHGYMQGPAIGLLMAELLLDGRTATVDMRAFRPGRFADGALIQEHNVI